MAARQLYSVFPAGDIDTSQLAAYYNPEFFRPPLNLGAYAQLPAADRYHLPLKVGTRLRVADFDYVLPSELIAQRPAANRDSSRLLVVTPNHGDYAGLPWFHRYFRELPELLAPGDCVVINDTRVRRARINARKQRTGAKVELLLLRRLDHDANEETQEWQALVRPGRRAQPGDTLVLAADSGITAEILAVTEDGGRRILFRGRDLSARLHAAGTVPLAPYITAELDDPERYQTIFARQEGSAAAPTAGLHFTTGLVQQLMDRNIEIVSLTLHVGIGTFRPVRVERVADHRLHPEPFYLPATTAAAIARTRQRGGRVIAVGTTVTRALEARAVGSGLVDPGAGETDLFITPGFQFQVVDALVTNFHLPRSTLLMLVAAFIGHRQALAAYQEAVRCRYRFFSFGDAMLLLPGRTAT